MPFAFLHNSLKLKKLITIEKYNLKQACFAYQTGSAVPGSEHP